MTASNGRGGWHYSLANNGGDTSDGSTDGWDLLALLDSGASGTPIGAFVKSEWKNFALPSGLNTDGSFDYNSDAQPGQRQQREPRQSGRRDAGDVLRRIPLADPLVQQTLSYINTHWTVFTGMGFSVRERHLSTSGARTGCSISSRASRSTVCPRSRVRPEPLVRDPSRQATGMPNTSTGSWRTRPRRRSTTGGNWAGLYFSCCEQDLNANTAIGELILSPVALIQPDPTTFSTVGLSPVTATNPPGTSHTVTATAVSSTGAPVPGATISFLVLTGPNAGKTGAGVTNAAGQVTFTYTDTSVGPYPVSDTIQAYIGQVGSNLPSNIVTKTWDLGILVCDADGDKDVDNADLEIIRNANGQVATGPNDPRDGNKDGKIDVADVRLLLAPQDLVTAGSRGAAARPRRHPRNREERDQSQP